MKCNFDVRGSVHRSTILTENPNKMQQRIKILLFLILNEALNVLTDFQKISQVSNFMNIHEVGTKLFHVDGWADTMKLDVCGSVHHSIIHKENPTRCNSVSKFHFVFT